MFLGSPLSEFVRTTRMVKCSSLRTHCEDPHSTTARQGTDRVTWLPRMPSWPPTPIPLNMISLTGSLRWCCPVEHLQHAAQPPTTRHWTNITFPIPDMSCLPFRHRETRRVRKGFTSPRTTTGHGLGDYYSSSSTTYMSTSVSHVGLPWRFFRASNLFPIISPIITRGLVTFRRG